MFSAFEYEFTRPIHTFENQTSLFVRAKFHYQLDLEQQLIATSHTNTWRVIFHIHFVPAFIPGFDFFEWLAAVSPSLTFCIVRLSHF